MTFSPYKFYAVFGVAFLALHIVGTVVMHLPYILNAVIVFVSVLFLLISLHRLVLRKPFTAIFPALGFKPTTFRQNIPAVLISVLLACLYPLLALILQIKITLAENWVFNLAGLFLTAGLAEEMLFRGYLFGGLRERMSFKRAAWISVIVFALAHLLMFTYMDFPIALMSTFLALGIAIPFAYFFEISGSVIWGVVFIHVVIRTIGMVVVPAEEKYVLFAGLWMLGCLLIPLVFMLFHPGLRKVWMNTENAGIESKRFTRSD